MSLHAWVGCTVLMHMSVDSLTIHHHSLHIANNRLLQLLKYNNGFMKFISYC